ncbi:MAG: bifunctional (p)ppGpp synthetase/guanosine-3',5'-bis(diphosphate) 3'-pyrophosphohydrolase [Bacteroidetes bacterium]|nr:bifunctional (p)ppGpp synthetase/guanosine-3',5'-bis(diphosphate) 3'-pyrophosphohydrolase [Bacteroidota bacterium]
MKLISDAILFAAVCHNGQYRKDGKTPYINHPLEVMHHLAHIADVKDTELLCAAVLHDVIEDTHATAAEIEKRYSKRISQIVEELTDDKHMGKTERKLMQVENAHLLSPEARLIRISDKICNVHDMHFAPPQNWHTTERLNYITWALSVVDQIRGTDARLEKAFDNEVRAAWQVLSHKPAQFM